MGIIKVKIPKDKLFVQYFLNWVKSNSSPAMNMMYKSPIVANNLTEPSGSMVFFPIRPKPIGPIKTPERIRPIIAGIFTFLKTIGESKIIKSISEKISTGF